MTPHERQQIVDRLDATERLIRSIHDQINGLATRERNGAAMASPHDYQNDQITAAKTKLVASAEKLVEAATALQSRLVAKAA